MKEPSNFVVGGNRYRVVEYDLKHGFIQMGKLMKLFGRSALGFLIEGLSALKDFGGIADIKDKIKSGLTVEEIFKSIDKERLVAAIGSFFDRVEPTEIFPMAEDILLTTESIKADGSHGPIDFNRELKGRYGVVMQLCRIVIAYQFADVFQDFFGGSTKAPKEQEQKVHPIAHVTAR